MPDPLKVPVVDFSLRFLSVVNRPNIVATFTAVFDAGEFDAALFRNRNGELFVATVGVQGRDGRFTRTGNFSVAVAETLRDAVMARLAIDEATGAEYA